MANLKERWKLVMEIWDVCNIWMQKPDGTTDDLENAIEAVFYEE